MDSDPTFSPCRPAMLLEGEMDEHAVDPLKLFVDGLTLVYHEGRHARHLIEGGHLAREGWELLLKLPPHRTEAWRQLQAVREAARQKPKVNDAMRVFENHFARTLDDLHELYQNPSWKHAKTVGGHAWRYIAGAVKELAKTIDHGDSSTVQKCCTDLLN